MEKTGIDVIDNAKRAEELAVRVHFAAQRVVDSRLGGGLGSFRVDEVDEELAAQLPSYINQYVGTRFPKLFYDEDGQLLTGGGTQVDQTYTRFHPFETRVNEETGMTQTWFSWDKALYDPEVAEAEAVAQDKQERKERRFRLLGRAAGTLAVCVSLATTGAMLNSLAHSAELTAQKAPQEEIAEAEEAAKNWMSLTMVEMVTVATGASGVMLYEVVRQSKRKNEELPPFTYINDNLAK